MSEFLGEARVVIRPDTTTFRTQLAAQLAAATKGITVPVNIVAAGAGALGGTAAATAQVGAATAATNAAILAQTAAIQQLTAALTANVGALSAQAAAQQAAGVATAQHTAAMQTADATSARLGKGAFSAAAALTGLRGAVLAANPAFLVGAIAAGALIKSLSEFAQFEQELNVFGATVGATGAQMQQVSALARELGADLSLPAVSASDAAAALTELAKAGLSVEDAMAGARGVLQLSTAAGITTGEAAQFAANQLNAFALAGDQAVRVADVLANAANSAQGSISDFGLAFKQSAAVANQVGLTLESTAAQLSVMARAGLQGSDAGTSLRVALLRLINPTKAAQAVIKDLGINLRDVNGNIRPDVFVQFAEATERMAPALRDANAAIVFGADGIRTLAVSAQAGRDGLVDATIAIGEQGTAAELAAARTAGFGGQLEGLQSSASTTALSLGELSTIIAGPLVFGLSQVSNFLNLTLEPLAELVRLGKEAAGLGGAFDPTRDSAAELLVQLQATREGFADLNERGIAIAPVQNAIKDTIAALENQRSTLKALGVDTSAITAEINRLTLEMQNLGTASGDSAVKITPLQAQLSLVQQEIAAGVPGLKRLAAELARLVAEAARATIQVNGLPDGITRLGITARNSAAGVDALAAAMSRLTRESTALSDQLQKAQAEGASPQAQIAILQQDNAVQQQKIAEAEKGGRTAGDITTIRKARDAIIANNAQIASLQAEIESDTRAAAASAKTKSDEIARNQAEATQAFIDGFDPATQKAQNAIAAAGLTERLSDDIKFQKILVEALRNQIDLIKDRIRRLGLQGAALKAAKAAIAALTQQINNLLLDIAKDQQAAQKRTQDILTQKLDFKIQIAQAQDNVAAEIRARRAKLAAITKELIAAKKEFGKNSVQWLELKAAQAEQIAAIKELENQSKTEGKDAGKSAQQFFFEQLQAQQGFAANLMGNLIPSSATGGLVGVPSDNLAGGPGRGISTAANVQQGKAGGGPSAGQANTTNALLERILNQLKTLNGATATPEATHQRRVGIADMDGPGLGGR